MLRSVQNYAARKLRNWTQQVHKAICSVCGDHLIVPFQPKPTDRIYCLECLHQRKRRSN